MSLFNILLIDYALEAGCKRFNLSKHGLEGILGLLLKRERSIISFIKLLKKIFHFKKGFVSTSSGSFMPKLARLDADRSRGTFGLNPSKKIFDPNVGFLQGRGDFVPPLPDDITLVLFELIFVMMNSSFIIVLNSLPKFKGS